jgi:hypothetical protein
VADPDEGEPDDEDTGSGDGDDGASEGWGEHFDHFASEAYEQLSEILERLHDYALQGGKKTGRDDEGLTFGADGGPTAKPLETPAKKESAPGFGDLHLAEAGIAEPAYADLAHFAATKGFTVTEINEKEHKVGSAHYKGKAIDVRTRDKTAEQVDTFIKDAKLPAESYCVHLDGRKEVLDQKMVPPCFIGRVWEREAERDPDVGGIMTMHDCSPFGAWIIEIGAQSTSGKGLTTLDDVVLELHLAVRA